MNPNEYTPVYRLAKYTTAITLTLFVVGVSVAAVELLVEPKDVTPDPPKFETRQAEQFNAARGDIRMSDGSFWVYRGTDNPNPLPGLQPGERVRWDYYWANGMPRN